jgi:hypothetical protein
MLFAKQGTKEEAIVELNSRFGEWMAHIGEGDHESKHMQNTR